MLTKMDMTAGFRKIQGMQRLYVTSDQFGEQILCKPADSLAECVALGGIMLRPDKANAASDFVVFLGADMHALLKRADPRIILGKAANVEFAPSGAAAAAAAQAFRHATVSLVGTILQGFTGTWEYCAVISKAASGYGASGGAAWYASFDQRYLDGSQTRQLNQHFTSSDMATPIATYAQFREAVAARYSANSNVFIGADATPPDYFLAGSEA